MENLCALSLLQYLQSGAFLVSSAVLIRAFETVSFPIRKETFSCRDAKLEKGPSKWVA